MDKKMKASGMLKRWYQNLPLIPALMAVVIPCFVIAIAMSGLICVIIYDSLQNIFGWVNGGPVGNFPAFFIIGGFIFGFMSIAGTIFYSIKIKTPITELLKGMDNISHQNLDFLISYQSKDEIGRLCKGFETMREELSSSFAAQWKMMADRDAMMQAFAHDLRTPLTVMRGHAELLELEAKEGAASKIEILEMVSLFRTNISNMEKYLETMRQMRTLNNWPLQKSEVELVQYANGRQLDYNALAMESGKQVQVNGAMKGTFLLDTALLDRVLGNLVDNALRYAQSKVSVTFSWESIGKLVITVEDDGIGFSPYAIQHGFDLFYRDTSRSGMHAGLGLSIVKSLIEQHGGLVELSNAVNGGGRVTIKI